MNELSKERWRDALSGALAFALFWSFVPAVHEPVWNWLLNTAEQAGAWAQSYGMPSSLAFLQLKLLAYMDDNPVIAFACKVLVFASLVGFAVQREHRRINMEMEEGRIPRRRHGIAGVRSGRSESSILNRQLLCVGFSMSILVWAWLCVCVSPAGTTIRSNRIISCCFRPSGIAYETRDYRRRAGSDTNETQHVENQAGLSVTNQAMNYPVAAP